MRWYSHAALGGSVLVTMSCDLSGLQDVGETVLAPDATLIDVPGIQLLEGEFAEVQVGFSAREGAHLIAFDEQTEPREVVIASYLGSYLEGASCSAGPADEMLVLWGSEEAPGFVVLLSDADEEGVGFLRIVGYDCKELIHFDAAKLPVHRFPTIEGESRRPLLVQLGDDSLRLVEDLEMGSSRLLAEHVADYRVTADGLWTIEEGRLAFRTSGSLFVDFGSEVTRLWARRGPHSDVIYEDAGELYRVAVADNGGLNQIRLQPGACEPTWNDDVLTYFAPCDTRRLIVQTFEPAADSSGYGSVDFVGPEGVASGDPFFGHAQVHRDERTLPSAVHFVVSTGQDNAREGSLHYAVLPGADELPSDGDSDFLPLVSLSTSAFRDGVQLHGGEPFARHDGEKGAFLSFVRSTTGSAEVSGLTTLLEGVTQLWRKEYLVEEPPWAAIGEVEEGVGKFFDLSETTCTVATCSTPKAVASGVPPQSPAWDPATERYAMVGQVEEGLGRLYLGTLGRSPIAPRPPVWAGKRARPDTLWFLTQPDGVAYLSGAASGPAELRMYLADSDLDVSIHDDVSWFSAPGVPSAGLLYQVARGADSGIWFAKAR